MGAEAKQDFGSHPDKVPWAGSQPNQVLSRLLAKPAALRTDCTAHLPEQAGALVLQRQRGRPPKQRLQRGAVHDRQPLRVQRLLVLRQPVLQRAASSSRALENSQILIGYEAAHGP